MEDPKDEASWISQIVSGMLSDDMLALHMGFLLCHWGNVVPAYLVSQQAPGEVGLPPRHVHENVLLGLELRHANRGWSFISMLSLCVYTGDRKV